MLCYLGTHYELWSVCNTFAPSPLRPRIRCFSHIIFIRITDIHIAFVSSTFIRAISVGIVLLFKVLARVVHPMYKLC